LDTLIGLAGAYSTAGRHIEANAAFERASARLTSLGRDDTARAATVFNNWGVSLTLLGRPVDAERALGRAIAISRDAEGDGAVSPMLLVNYARTLQDVGRLNDAAAFGERGLDKARKAGAGVVVSQALLLLGSIDRNLGDLDGAERRLSEVDAWLRRNLP